MQSHCSSSTELGDTDPMLKTQGTSAVNINMQCLVRLKLVEKQFRIRHQKT